MILVLHGAKKNVGDFLIHDRGRRVLAHLLPGEELVSLPRWQPLDPALARSAKAIVLCGGPGLATDFYPGIFPLVDDLSTLNVPILPLALGWSGRPADQPEDFEFSKPSLDTLRLIHDRIGWSSVRDDISKSILRVSGITNVRRTGCVAWYHIPSLGRPFEQPRDIRHLVVTTPAHVRLVPETIRVLRTLQRRYPTAERTCVFHRGIKADRYTSPRDSVANRTVALAARSLGYSVVDAAYDLTKIAFYGDVDLHVGYRVHAHLSVLSQRRPSILISEDGRGRGQVASLGDPYELSAFDPTLPEKLDSAIERETAGFEGTRAAIDEIERCWPSMQQTIRQLTSRDLAG